MANNALSVMALACSLIGNGLINKKMRIGFVIWLVSNILWIIQETCKAETNWWLVLMFVVYIGFNVHGWMNWKRQE